MVVTAGGLVFIGTPDQRLRAYDADTGKVIWEKAVSGPIQRRARRLRDERSPVHGSRSRRRRHAGRRQWAVRLGKPAAKYVVFALSK
jgi:hypothetical protein